MPQIAFIHDDGTVEILVEDARKAFEPTDEEIEDLDNDDILDGDDLVRDIKILLAQSAF